MFETTARSLVEHAGTQPLVLVLDDLHAADQLSLQAFRVLARELSHIGTVVIGIYRDSEIKRFQEFGDLLLDPLMRDSKRISLAAFDDEETREFARSRTGSPPEAGTLAALHSLTGGNPRLLEIAFRRRLLDDTQPGSGKWLGSLLRAEIEGHLEHLSAQAREVLSTASLAGVEFRVSTLFHVLEQSPEELLDSLHEAEESGLLGRSETPGTYHFRQTMVQRILYAELSGARRARLHRRFAEVLEGLHPDDDAYIELIACHLYEAALLGHTQRAAESCTRAAAHADGESRAEDRLRFYHMALVALEVQGSNPDAIRDLRARLDEVNPHRIQRYAPELRPSSSSGAVCESGIAIPNAAPNGAHESALKPPCRERVDLSPDAELSASPLLPPPVPTETERARDAVRRIGGQSRAQRSNDSAGQSSSEIQQHNFRREADFWTLIFEGRVLRFKHSNGLLFVAHLLQHPDRDFHATQLVALLPSASANRAETAYVSRADKERLGMHTVSGPDANPLLDPTAKAEYRRRIEELRAAMEDAKAFNDAARSADLERELDFIGLELSRAVGAGGRDRKHRAEDERARVNVTNAIRTLTAKIAKESPSFGRYLRLAIRTGRYCSYRPDPVSAPRWQF